MRAHEWTGCDGCVEGHSIKKQTTQSCAQSIVLFFCRIVVSPTLFLPFSCFFCVCCFFEVFSLFFAVMSSSAPSSNAAAAAYVSTSISDPTNVPASSEGMSEKDVQHHVNAEITRVFQEVQLLEAIQFMKRSWRSGYDACMTKTYSPTNFFYPHADKIWQGLKKLLPQDNYYLWLHYHQSSNGGKILSVTWINSQLQPNKLPQRLIDPIYRDFVRDNAGFVAKYHFPREMVFARTWDKINRLRIDYEQRTIWCEQPAPECVYIVDVDDPAHNWLSDFACQPRSRELFHLANEPPFGTPCGVIGRRLFVHAKHSSHVCTDKCQKEGVSVAREPVEAVQDQKGKQKCLKKVKRNNNSAALPIEEKGKDEKEEKQNVETGEQPTTCDSPPLPLPHPHSVPPSLSLAPTPTPSASQPADATTANTVFAAQAISLATKPVVMHPRDPIDLFFGINSIDSRNMPDVVTLLKSLPAPMLPVLFDLEIACSLEHMKCNWPQFTGGEFVRPLPKGCDQAICNQLLNAGTLRELFPTMIASSCFVERRYCREEEKDGESYWVWIVRWSDSIHLAREACAAKGFPTMFQVSDCALFPYLNRTLAPKSGDELSEREIFAHTEACILQFIKDFDKHAEKFPEEMADVPPVFIVHHEHRLFPMLPAFVDKHRGHFTPVTHFRIMLVNKGEYRTKLHLEWPALLQRAHCRRLDNRIRVLEEQIQPDAALAKENIALVHLEADRIVYQYKLYQVVSSNMHALPEFKSSQILNRWVPRNNVFVHRIHRESAMFKRSKSLMLRLQSILTKNDAVHCDMVESTDTAAIVISWKQDVHSTYFVDPFYDTLPQPFSREIILARSVEKALMLKTLYDDHLSYCCAEAMASISCDMVISDYDPLFKYAEEFAGLPELTQYTGGVRLPLSSRPDSSRACSSRSYYILCLNAMKLTRTSPLPFPSPSPSPSPSASLSTSAALVNHPATSNVAVTTMTKVTENNRVQQQQQQDEHDDDPIDYERENKRYLAQKEQEKRELQQRIGEKVQWILEELKVAKVLDPSKAHWPGHSPQELRVAFASHSEMYVHVDMLAKALMDRRFDHGCIVTVLWDASRSLVEIVLSWRHATVATAATTATVMLQDINRLVKDFQRQVVLMRESMEGVSCELWLSDHPSMPVNCNTFVEWVNKAWREGKCDARVVDVEMRTITIPASPTDAVVAAALAGAAAAPRDSAAALQETTKDWVVCTLVPNNNKRRMERVAVSNLFCLGTAPKVNMATFEQTMSPKMAHALSMVRNRIEVFREAMQYMVQVKEIDPTVAEAMDKQQQQSSIQSHQCTIVIGHHDLDQFPDDILLLKKYIIEAGLCDRVFHTNYKTFISRSKLSWAHVNNNPDGILSGTELVTRGCTLLFYWCDKLSRDTAQQMQMDDLVLQFERDAKIAKMDITTRVYGGETCPVVKTAAWRADRIHQFFQRTGKESWERQVRVQAIVDQVYQMKKENAGVIRLHVDVGERAAELYALLTNVPDVNSVCIRRNCVEIAFGDTYPVWMAPNKPTVTTASADVKAKDEDAKDEADAMEEEEEEEGEDEEEEDEEEEEEGHLVSH